MTVNRGQDYLREGTAAFWREYTGASPKATSAKQGATLGHRGYTPLRTNNAKKRDIIFLWPLSRQKFWISSYFGWRMIRQKRNFHYGIDLAALKGTHVYAVAAGSVLESRYAPGYGNTIVIKHNHKYKTRYAHLDTLRVKRGQEVERGDFIGTVGDTGHVRKSGRDASHLHFEVYVFGKQVNPLAVLP